MKQSHEKEMDYFVAYLYGHLRDHRFPEATDPEFINTRAGEAYKTMTHLILEGRSQSVAEELAMRVLIEGHYVSRWDVIFNLLEELFHNDLPTEEAKLSGQNYCSDSVTSTPYLTSMKSTGTSSAEKITRGYRTS